MSPNVVVPTVVLIEAEPLIVDDIVRMLGEDYEVIVHATGRSALDALRAGISCDVILCDAQLPDLTAVDIFGTLGSIRPDLSRRMLFLADAPPAPAPATAKFFKKHRGRVLDMPFTKGELLQRLKAGCFV